MCLKTHATYHSSARLPVCLSRQCSLTISTILRSFSISKACAENHHQAKFVLPPAKKIPRLIQPLHLIWLFPALKDIKSSSSRTYFSFCFKLFTVRKDEKSLGRFQLWTEEDNLFLRLAVEGVWVIPVLVRKCLHSNCFESNVIFQDSLLKLFLSDLHTLRAQKNSHL